MSAFVICCKPFFLVAYHSASFFRSGNNFRYRFLYRIHFDCLVVYPCRMQGRLVQQVFQIGRSESGSPSRKNFQIDVLVKRFVFRVDFQYGLAAPDVGYSNAYLPVESSRSEKCRVKNVRSVGCGYDYYSLMVSKPVHFNEKLIEGLLPLIMSSAQACASFSSHSINFIYENYAWGTLLGLFKKISDSRSSHTYKHFNKIGSAYAEKWYSGFSCNCSRQICLSCSRRSYHQYPFGDSRTQFDIFSWIS